LGKSPVGRMESATWESKVQPATVSAEYNTRITEVLRTDEFKQNLENVPKFKA